jgi:hypothetical protein
MPLEQGRAFYWANVPLALANGQFLSTKNQFNFLLPFRSAHETNETRGDGRSHIFLSR